jgi:hypothetical protein
VNVLLSILADLSKEQLFGSGYAGLGSNECPLRVPIVGSGPSGFYVGEKLYKANVPA